MSLFYLPLLLLELGARYVLFRLKEWADKKAKEKDDRKERKRQRIERILEGPSRIKAEDNTYISEVISD